MNRRHAILAPFAALIPKPEAPAIKVLPPIKMSPDVADAVLMQCMRRPLSFSAGERITAARLNALGNPAGMVEKGKAPTNSLRDWS